MNGQFYMHFETMPKGTSQQKGVQVIHGKPHFYEKPKVRSARYEFTRAMLPYKPKKPSERPVKLSVTFYFDVKTRSLWGKVKPTKPDTENYLKLLKDCMTDAGFWKDDAQVVDEHVKKYYAEKATIAVYWEEVMEEMT